MNENKKGKPYSYSNPLSLSLVTLRFTFIYPIDKHRRNNQRYKKKLTLSSQLWPICRRVNKLDIDRRNQTNDNDDDDVIIAIDSTGIKVTNRGLWLRDKWNVKKNKKKGNLKIHVSVNIMTKEILVLEVTNEKVHNSIS